MPADYSPPVRYPAIPLDRMPFDQLKRREFISLLGGAVARPAGKVHRRHSDGRTFFCPHCGALYSVTCPRLSKIGSNVAKCVVCLQTMDEWDLTEIRVHKLIQRPEDA
jgi:hypothetical protein